MHSANLINQIKDFISYNTGTIDNVSEITKTWFDVSLIAYFKL